MGGNTSFPAGAVRSIVVNGLGGNDTLRIDDAQFAFTTTRPTRIEGGNGNDVIRGGKGAETLRGGLGSDTITGLRGNDRVDLGDGPDLSIWTVGQGNDQVTGGPGSDTQRAVGTGAVDAITLAIQSGRARVAAGAGSTRSTGVEALVVRAGGGADLVHIPHLAGSNLTGVTVDLGVNGTGDGAADQVVVTGSVSADVIVAIAVGVTPQVNGIGGTLSIAQPEAGNDRLTDEPRLRERFALGGSARCAHPDDAQR